MRPFFFNFASFENSAFPKGKFFHKKILLAVCLLPLFGGCAHIKSFLNPVPQEEDISSEDFMAEIYKEPGVIKRPSGLAYKIIESGAPKAPHAKKKHNMMLTYEGRLPDGAIFDSSEQHTGAAYMEMPLDGVIEGWMEALPLMRVGDIWELYIPENLAYGERTMGVIPSHSALVFKIHLMGVDESSPEGEQEKDDSEEDSGDSENAENADEKDSAKAEAGKAETAKAESKAESSATQNQKDEYSSSQSAPSENSQ